MLKIKANVISKIITYAKSQAPIEACGYLAEKEGVIVQQYPMKNVDASPIHYSLDPEEQFKVVKDIHKKGLKLAAVYHSHPTTLAHPSEEDIRLAYDPDLSYVIISLVNGSGTLKSFKIRNHQVKSETIDIIQNLSDGIHADQGPSQFYKIPDNLDAEIDELEVYIQRYKDGQITKEEFKARRVPFGVYAQRTKDTYMVRIRIPGGCVTPSQLKTMAALSAEYGRDSLHITTRQAFQIHDVVLEDIVPVIRGLKKVGLATRGGGGNTVRNITASWDAGIATDDVFDVTGHALSLTNRLIAEPDSWLVPRKFKISFSNSKNDNSNATFNDLGFIARIKNGQKGFKVYVAGGLGLKPHVGNLLHEFIPEEQTYLVAESVKRLFLKYGNRKNKHAARLRFLWNKLGKEKFVERYHQEFKKLQDQSVNPFIVTKIENKSNPDLHLEPVEINSPGYDVWKLRYVRQQRQAGLHAVLIPVFLGDLTCDHAVALADFLNHFGENVLRCTLDQNLSIRNIPGKYLGNVYQIAASVSGLSKEPEFVSHCIACTGANTCTLGICLSQNALRAMDRKLKASALNLDKIRDLKLRISGCPDTCGNHMAADIGFLGKSSRKNQIAYPAYNIVAGAVARDGRSRLARKIDMISARNLPDFMVDFLNLYLSKKDNYASFAVYIDDCGEADIRDVCDKYRDIPDFEDDKNFYFDWGATEVFSVAGIGMGECSAGLFDLIDVDRNIIKNLQKERTLLSDPDRIGQALYKMILSASRMLLITRGVEARSEGEVFDEFDKHFIESGLVDSRFIKLITAARHRDDAKLRKLEDQIYELSLTMEALYASMDDSLRFPSEIQTQIKEHNNTKPASDEDQVVFKDYRGVVCPMNFVKVKLDLAAMAKGQKLKVLLDDGAPINNVPRSAADEGHDIIEQKKEGDHWSVLIRKG